MGHGSEGMNTVLLKTEVRKRKEVGRKTEPEKKGLNECRKETRGHSRAFISQTYFCGASFPPAMLTFAPWVSVAIDYAAAAISAWEASERSPW